jgi:hypothetical protein
LKLTFAYLKYQKDSNLKFLGIKIAFISCVFTFGCTQNPKDILDEKTMARLVVELQRSEVTVNQLNLAGTDSAKVVYKILENKVFKRFKTDSTAYAKSFNWYAKDKAKLFMIYSKADELLKKERDKLTGGFTNKDHRPESSK